MTAPTSSSSTSISGRNLLAQFAVAALVLLGVNLAVARLAVNSVPRQLLRHGEAVGPATDLFFGNSTMAAGIDEAAFAATKPGRPVNLGLGATAPVEHLLLLRRQPLGPDATVYYGFFDTQLTDPPNGTWETLIGNRAMSYYVEPEVAIDYYAGDDPWHAWQLRLVRHVPVFVERRTLWAKVEIARRYFGELGLPKQEVNRFGRAADFTLLEADIDDFTSRCRSSVANDQPLAPEIAAFFEQVRQAGAKLRLVEMPMNAGHRSRYYTRPEWHGYRAHIKKLADKFGADYIAAADWIDDRGFADNLHLNPRGARQFSQRLAQRVQENP